MLPCACTRLAAAAAHAAPRPAATLRPRLLCCPPHAQVAFPRRAPLRVRAARIGGVEVPNQKYVEFSLQYIFGIGPTSAKAILVSTGVENKRTKVRACRVPRACCVGAGCCGGCWPWAPAPAGAGCAGHCLNEGGQVALAATCCALLRARVPPALPPRALLCCPRRPTRPTPRHLTPPSHPHLSPPPPGPDRGRADQAARGGGQLHGGGRPAPLQRPQHQAPERDWLLPRAPPLQQPARARAAHQEQRAHPQGQGQAHRRCVPSVWGGTG